MQDDAAVSEMEAQDLCGLSPDEAALVCYEQAVALTVSVADMVEVRGWDPSRVRVTEQWPRPGDRMDSNAVLVRVDFVEGGGRVYASLDGRIRHFVPLAGAADGPQLNRL